MSRWSGRHEECPECGLVYENLRTGYTYKEVRMLLWVADDDYRTGNWKYKRRNTVLGLWHQIKKSLWKEHLYYCEMIALAKEEAAHDKEMEQRLPEERAELDDLLEREPGCDDVAPEDFVGWEYSQEELDEVPF